jgi:hypothetical protein
MKGLLSAGSPYLEAAKQKAMATANSRGLLNSSMAATAGEKAAIESALPIATQDATTQANAEMAGYQGKLTAAQTVLQASQTEELAKLQAGLTTQTGAAQAILDAALKSGLSAQEAAQTTALATIQAALQSKLNTETALAESALATLKAGFASGLSAQEATQAVYLAAQQGLIQQGLSQQEIDAQMAQLKTKIEGENGILAKQLAANKEIELIQQEGANLRSSAENALTAAKLTSEELTDGKQKLAAFSDGYATQITAVQRDNTLSADAKTTILAQLRTQYLFNINMVGDLYGITIAWEAPEVDTTGTPTTETPITIGENTGQGFGTSSEASA